MRHRKLRSRLNRDDGHRKATLAMIAKSLFAYQSIKTTHAKAKEARRLAEKLITIAKKNNLSAKRNVFSVLRDGAITLKLFKEIMPLFASRNGGYTRIIPLKRRQGDGAEMVILELTEKIKTEEKPKKEKKIKEKAKKPETKEKPKPEIHKSAPEITPAVKEEKVVEDVRKEKAKEEKKRIEKKGFFKKFFRRRTSM